MAGVAPERRAELTRLADGPSLLHLAGHWGAIALCAGLIAAGVSGWWLLIPVQGVLIVFLFTLTHECTHKTVFRTTWLNEFVGHISGFFVLLPLVWFRYFHLAHHRWTNMPGHDPELDGPEIAGLRDWLWQVSGLPYWRAQCAVVWRLVRHRERPEYLPSQARVVAQRHARVMLVLYALALTSLLLTPLLFWVWLLPAFVMMPVLRLYLLAEHGDCPQVADMLANTRTTMTVRAVRWLAWNMPFHAEHHVWPAVPFHQLPELHTDMAAHLRSTSTGYAAFNTAYLARRLNGEKSVAARTPR